MNFKSIGLKAAVATAVVAGSAMSMAPAQAGNLFPGTFNLKGKSSITADSPNDSAFTISFSGFSIESGTGSPTVVFAGANGLTGTPSVGTLSLQRVGVTSMFNITSGLTNFVIGLKQDAKAIVLNLAAGSQLNGNITNVNHQYSFDGDLLGTLAFAPPNVGSVPAEVGLGAFRFRVNNRNEAEIGVKTIPTPALLPGLIGMGVAALRKRKSEESDVEAAETAKA